MPSRPSVCVKLMQLILWTGLNCLDQTGLDRNTVQVKEHFRETARPAGPVQHQNLGDGPDLTGPRNTTYIWNSDAITYLSNKPGTNRVVLVGHVP